MLYRAERWSYMKNIEKLRHLHCCVCGFKLGKGKGKETELELKCPNCKSILDVKIVDGSTITTKVMEPNSTMAS